MGFSRLKLKQETWTRNPIQDINLADKKAWKTTQHTPSLNQFHRCLFCKRKACYCSFSNGFNLEWKTFSSPAVGFSISAPPSPSEVSLYIDTDLAEKEAWKIAQHIPSLNQFHRRLFCKRKAFRRSSSNGFNPWLENGFSPTVDSLISAQPLPSEVGLYYIEVSADWEASRREFLNQQHCVEVAKISLIPDKI